MLVPELTRAFNKRFGAEKTACMIKSTLTNHGITCGRTYNKKSWRATLFTQGQNQFLRDNYPLMKLVDLTAAVNREFGLVKTWQQVKTYLTNHDILSGRSGCFEKGLVPWNSGTKGICKPNSGNFRNGHMPANKKRLWSERVGKAGYIEISIPERNPYTGFAPRFKQKHVWLWEYHHGPVPKGNAVVFSDGNKLNIVIENLMLVTKNELLLLNLHKYWQQPEEIRPSIMALVKMEAAAKIRTTGRQPGAGRKKKVLQEG